MKRSVALLRWLLLCASLCLMASGLLASSGTIDSISPQLAITSPAAALNVYDSNTVVELNGTASGTVAITNLACIVNGAAGNPISLAPSLPSRSVKWMARVDLSQAGRPGTNVLAFIAQDLHGSQAAVTRTVRWIETNKVTLNVNPSNAGTIKGIKNGQVLQVGASCVVTATPMNKNWLFSTWTDAHSNILSGSATFQYIDETGTLSNSTPPVLTANFVPNPFTNSALTGAYTGLYYDAIGGPQTRDAGYIAVTVTGTGAYSGKLFDAGSGNASFPFSGQLSEAPDGTFAIAAPSVIKVGAHAYAQPILKIATDPVLTNPGAGLLTGYVGLIGSLADTNGYLADIEGQLSTYNTNILAGLYNLAITPASADPSQAPGGYSYGTATVNNKKGSAGNVALALNLADGTTPAVSFSSALARDGTCPFYASLYGGYGIILGWLHFSTNGSGQVSSASIDWLAAANATYPKGFNALPAAFGSLYVPPKAGTNLFGQGATTLAFKIDPGYAGLSLPDGLTLAANFNPAKNTVTFMNSANKASLKLTASTGTMTGNFVIPPAIKNPFAFHAINIAGAAYGFCLDPANKQTGPIRITPGP
ncbi:MAG TPA: hypothetical protein VGO59_15755 [Verrucomicrobiae bacterium]